MLKYTDTKVVFREIPDEISLAINISGCPFTCKGCHSSFLQGDIGETLSTSVLDTLIKKYDAISCISFMGGDNDPHEVSNLAGYVRANYPKVMTAWYSGADILSEKIELKNFTYIKVGRFIEILGGLDSKNTNQRIYSVDDECVLHDITYRMTKTTPLEKIIG